MEQNQEKNLNKLQHVEITDLNKKIKDHLEEAKKKLEWSIKSIEECKQYIEYDKKNIQRMTEQNEWIYIHEGLAKEMEQEKYTSQDFEKVNEDISKNQKIIDMLQEQIEMIKNYQLISGDQVKGLEQIEKKFKEILANINPEDKN